MTPSKFCRIFKSIKKLFYIFIFLPFLFKAQGIVVGDTTSPNITYNNIVDYGLADPFCTVVNWDVDIDGDSSNDIRFSHNHCSSPGSNVSSNSVFSLDSLDFVIASGYQYLDTLPINSVINGSLLWKSGVSGKLLHSSYWSAGNPWTSIIDGIFLSNDKYLGFRKKYTTDTIYGWILIDKVNYSIKIKSWAYEKHAGVWVKENKLIENSISIFPNPTKDKLSIKNKGKQKIEQTKLYSTNGREVSLTKLEENVYDASSLPEGIYFLQIKLENGVLNKKIVIQH